MEVLDAAGAVRERAALVDILRDAVDSGASVGFLPPLSIAEAEAYWADVIAAVSRGVLVLVVARETDAVVGTAQLALAEKANARHRAEVQKVMVHTRARRRGIGRALMEALAQEARRRGRSTLVLDTRENDPSEGLYRVTGYHRVGVVPEYARSAGGALHGTAFYYQLVPSLKETR
ncbi:MAG: GNAT family N-acetyltransferase [Candidatus Rokubacteria bacterium]|nr:GNAT family N-acetyltransferase [Candidatus Rokubacteria bacterium]